MNLISPELFTAILTLHLDDPSQFVDKEKRVDAIEKKIKFLKERKAKGKISKAQTKDMISLEAEQKRRLAKRKKKGLDTPKAIEEAKRNEEMGKANIDPAKIKKIVSRFVKQ